MLKSGLLKDGLAVEKRYGCPYGARPGDLFNPRERAALAISFRKKPGA